MADTSQIWELKTDKPIELSVGPTTKKVVQSTRALAAAAGPQKAKVPSTQPGVRMPKPKCVRVASSAPLTSAQGREGRFRRTLSAHEDDADTMQAFAF